MLVSLHPAVFSKHATRGQVILDLWCHALRRSVLPNLANFLTFSRIVLEYVCLERFSIIFRAVLQNALTSDNVGLPASLVTFREQRPQRHEGVLFPPATLQGQSRSPL